MGAKSVQNVSKMGARIHQDQVARRHLILNRCCGAIFKYNGDRSYVTINFGLNCMLLELRSDQETFSIFSPGSEKQCLSKNS